MNERRYRDCVVVYSRIRASKCDALRTVNQPFISLASSLFQQSHYDSWLAAGFLSKAYKCVKNA
ncbi:CLUMA_CG015992, isoform A [Clunio marinus]|uniref:CLUMA_CG015992, isoform A n=1 Tax=Clunio marinus TaxID=568069 RepID=A0A1J1IUJ6_9DIPT|nr:CLUMA_CG015992, isoform A [Clunio marinus]